ncbi:MAG TPA: FAD-binding oxidoreductase [Thermoanaerobaculia bacterium]
MPTPRTTSASGSEAGAAEAARKACRGEVLAPGDAPFDAARRVYNGAVDRRPAAIVRCAGVADVVAAVRLARAHGLPLAVRGGGHSAAGFGVCDGGLVADLSAMKGVRVDPGRRTAEAQAGLTWGELDHETQAFGLATTGGRISSIGIAGMTLGGGYGWLMRRHGLAVDNLLAADLVTADGGLLTASAAENADLFWGLRGGGGNFGVVTALTYRLHPVGPTVTGGMAFYAAERARELLYAWRDFAAASSEDLATQLNFLLLPPAPFVPPHLVGAPVVAVPVCHLGPPEAAARDLAPLREWGPLIDRIRPLPYARLQRLYDAAGAFGHLTYGRSGHLPRLGDDAVEALAAVYATGLTSPCSIVMLSPLGGAVARVGEHSTAFSFRRTAFDLAVQAVWSDARESRRHIRWADAAWTLMRPFTRGVYVNELGDEGPERVREAYNPRTWRRLVELKRRYDPDNLFRLNHNIDPAQAVDREEVPHDHRGDAARGGDGSRPGRVSDRPSDAVRP